ncbi:hypothetical protein GCM10027089_23770 [Nocardia thraciensis]
MGFEIEFDDKTQAFLDWVAPDRMESQIRTFLSETLEGVADYDADNWWSPPVSTRIMDAAKLRFGSRDEFLSSEHRDAADQFIRFLGECYVRRAGMEWTNQPDWAGSLFPDFGPAVRYDDDVRSVTLIADDLFDDKFGGTKSIEYNISDAVKLHTR